MTLRSIFAGSTCVISMTLLAQVADADCLRFSADRTAEAATTGISKIMIGAGAGDLKVRGTSDVAQVHVKGKACADSQARLDAIRIDVRRECDTLHIDAVLPDIDFALNNRSLDLAIEVPATLPIGIEDSSGDIDVAQVAAVRVTDSSGDIDIKSINGNVEVSDSSGDVVIADVAGDVAIPVDSSGNLVFRRVHGDVHITTDSSGDISASEINNSVTIDNDSSGDIRVATVGGDLTVAHDSSGDVDHRDVLGKVSIPRSKRDDD